MGWFPFVILALASWRIASLLVDEAGPLDVFEKLRVVVGIKYDEKNEPYASNELSKQFMCIWCMSLYVAILLCCIFYLFNWFMFVLVPFAIGAIAMLCDKHLWRGWKRGH